MQICIETVWFFWEKKNPNDNHFGNEKWSLLPSSGETLAIDFPTI